MLGVRACDERYDAHDVAAANSSGDSQRRSRRSFAPFSLQRGDAVSALSRCAHVLSFSELTLFTSAFSMTHVRFNGRQSGFFACNSHVFLCFQFELFSSSERPLSNLFETFKRRTVLKATRSLFESENPDFIFLQCEIARWRRNSTSPIARRRRVKARRARLRTSAHARDEIPRARIPRSCTCLRGGARNPLRRPARRGRVLLLAK